MRRLFSHRPSAALVISLIALLFAMGGTAVAATGGNFILGKANTATSTSTLTNTKGTALSLSSTSTTPPLRVSNGVQVPNLNASKLDGKTSSAFLPATGTAANSSKLGGIPASGYMQGGGHTTGVRLTLPNSIIATLLTGPGADLLATCDPTAAPTGPAFIIEGNTGAVAGTTAVWWNRDGVGSNTALKGTFSAVTPGSGSTTPYAVVVQVDNVTTISTFTATEWYNSGSDTCHFTGQVVTTNG
jgi:hypothetical protein